MKKEDLIQAFDDLKKALSNNDVNKLREIILDGYKGFSLNGTVEIKDDILEHFKPGCIKLSKYEVLEIEYEIFAEIGIISGKGIIAGSYGKYDFKHKVLFIDIFKYDNSKWSYFKSQVTEIQTG